MGHNLDSPSIKASFLIRKAMAVIQIKNQKIAYDDAGKGPVLLLIHGFPLNRQMWQPQIIGLSTFARIIAIDLRGHGDSELTEGENTMEIMAEDCFNLLDGLRILQPIILCGLSMGGYICFSAYRKYSDRISGLILTATRAAADSDLAKLNREQAIKTIQEVGPEQIIDSMLPRLLSPNNFEKRKELVDQVRTIMRTIHPQTMINDLKGLKNRPDSTDILASINKPVLIIHGQEDQIVPLEEARQMQKRIPEAELTVIPEAGHLPNLEQPTMFNQAAHRFLEKIKA